MRSKFVVAALSGLFMAGVALAQSGTVEPAVAPPADTQNILNLDLSTGGRVQILLRPDKAPYSVERVKTLVRRHFYDGLIFHRVIEGFMAQGGDPKGTGEGGSDLPDLKAEFNDLPHVRGTMSMARAEGLDSANSQFFIMMQPNLGLDGNYTAIGRVISGIQFVDKIEKGEPPEHPSKVIHASIESDDLGQAPAAFVPPVPAPAAQAPVATGKHGKKQKKAEDKQARKQADEDAKAKAKQAKVDAKSSAEKAKADAKAEKQAKAGAVREAKAGAASAKADADAAKKKEALAAAEAKKAEKQAAEDAKKAERAAKKAAKTASPAPPAVQAAPSATDAAVRAVSDQPQSAVPSTTDAAVQALTPLQPATDSAVQAVSSDETVAKPQ